MSVCDWRFGSPIISNVCAVAFYLFQSIALELLLGWASCLFYLWDEA